MLKVTLTGGDEVEREAEELAKRLEDLTPTDAAVRAAVVEQNAGVNFDPSHPGSNLEVRDGNGAIGSSSSAYARLLDVDVEEIADIEDEYFDGGAG